MFNCFYSLSRFCSDILDLLICTFDAYFIKLFRISYISDVSVKDVDKRLIVSCWTHSHRFVFCYC